MKRVPQPPHPRHRQRRRMAVLVGVMLIASLCLPWFDAYIGGIRDDERNGVRSIFSGMPGMAVFLLSSLFCPPVAVCPLLAIAGIRALLRNRREEVCGYALATLVLGTMLLTLGMSMALFWAGPQLLFVGVRSPRIGIGVLVWCAALLTLFASSRLCGHADEWSGEHPLADFVRRHRKTAA